MVYVVIFIYKRKNGKTYDLKAINQVKADGHYLFHYYTCMRSTGW